MNSGAVVTSVNGVGRRLCRHGIGQTFGRMPGSPEWIVEASGWCGARRHEADMLRAEIDAFRIVEYAGGLTLCVMPGHALENIRAA